MMGGEIAALMGFFGLTGAFAVVGTVLAGWMAWRIVEKTGLPGWTGLGAILLTLTGVGTIVPLVLLWVFAFMRWPRDEAAPAAPAVPLPDRRGWQLSGSVAGGGAVILGRCAGEPVIDALGTRWLTVRDLTVLGDPTATPSTGVQVGVLSKEIVADDHRFENIKILGHFSLACLYNRGAETSSFDHLLLWNDHRGSYCLIQDGTNHFGLVSRFATGDIPTDTALSFNENLFTNCDFRQGGYGTPLWLGDTARHAFIRCYAETEGGPYFVIYCGQNGHVMLDIDCHCETQKVSDAFLFTGPSKRLAIRGFSYIDHYCFAHEVVFRCAEHVSHIELQNARLEIATFFNAGCALFDDATHWRVSGSYYSNDVGHWNGGEGFTGTVTIGPEVRFSGLLAAVLQVAPLSGTTPPATARGSLFRDTATDKLLVWTGSRWVDALGQPVVVQPHKP